MGEFDCPALGEEPILVGHDEKDSASRIQIIRWLQHLPHITDGLKKLAPSDTFRVIMSPENAKFFKQAADGSYKPFLRNGGKFVENVDLRKVSPDHLGAASSLLLSVNMAAIAADLNAIKMGVHDLSALISDSLRGEVYGTISAVRQAKALRDPTERRRETLGACRDLSTQLGKLSGQLKAHVNAMPEPKTGIFDGFLGSGLNEADAKWREVEQDLLLLRDGLTTLLGTYNEIGEPGAARQALSGILKALRSVDLPNAARKARLVRMPAASLAPEAVIRKIFHAAATIEQRFLEHEVPLLLPVVLDIKPEELALCQTPPEPASAGGS